MKKNLTYRDKLLELTRIYGISEIQNYIKRKKNLTTSQIEHILKKNNVPIPKEINTSFFRRNIYKPIDKAGKELSNLYQDTKSSSGKLILGTWKRTGNFGVGILNVFPKLIQTTYNFFVDTIVDLLNGIYNTKLNQKKTNKLIANIGLSFASAAVIIVGVTVFNNFKNNKTINSSTVVSPKSVIEKPDKKDVAIKSLKKEEPKKKIKPSKKEEKKSSVAKIPEKNPSKLKDLVLPNLNLKTATVLTLFEDVEYDLKTVRFQKRVKPIYFTQFPKDLDEIKDVKLKKETFIKIVLPLVVAENEKILNDRLKLKKILSRKNTSDKEKLWLRQKLREYKVKKSNMKELEKRMDIIPVSIALAQAAKESGWGTSRFALEGNAIFGQWTWTGKGIEPLERGKHEAHKILRFPILRSSVKSYKNNLNTHKGYSQFREQRYELRERNKFIRGLSLINYLDKYAQTGKEYIKILEQIINQNDLSDFEAVQLTNSNIKQELNL